MRRLGESPSRLPLRSRRWIIGLAGGVTATGLVACLPDLNGEGMDVTEFNLKTIKCILSGNHI